MLNRTMKVVNRQFCRIVSGFFVVGIEVRQLCNFKNVNKCPPIIGYIKNWSFNKVKSYCGKRGWELEILKKEYDCE